MLGLSSEKPQTPKQPHYRLATIDEEQKKDKLAAEELKKGAEELKKEQHTPEEEAKALDKELKEYIDKILYEGIKGKIYCIADYCHYSKQNNIDETWEEAFIHADGKRYDSVMCPKNEIPKEFEKSLIHGVVVTKKTDNHTKIMPGPMFRNRTAVTMDLRKFSVKVTFDNSYYNKTACLVKPVQYPLMSFVFPLGKYRGTFITVGGIKVFFNKYFEAEGLSSWENTHWTEEETPSGTSSFKRGPFASWTKESKVTKQNSITDDSAAYFSTVIASAGSAGRRLAEPTEVQAANEVGMSNTALTGIVGAASLALFSLGYLLRRRWQKRAASLSKTDENDIEEV